MDEMRHEIDVTMHPELLMNLYSPNAEAINDDPLWKRARILLGALFQKHGGFQIEVLNKKTRVF